MNTSEVRRVKKSRKSNSCDWCGQLIKVGEPKVTWFCYSDPCTVRMHPECFAAQCVWAKESCEDELPLPGDYSRGCYCGENPDHCDCETAKKAEGEG